MTKTLQAIREIRLFPRRDASAANHHAVFAEFAGVLKHILYPKPQAFRIRRIQGL